MLANGVQMKQIQEWLGHSNFSTTADVLLQAKMKAMGIGSVEELFLLLGKN